MSGPRSEFIAKHDTYGRLKAGYISVYLAPGVREWVHASEVTPERSATQIARERRSA